MTKNTIAPELLTRIARIPGLEYRYTEADGHMLVARTPSGLADRVAIFGNGQRALEALHMAVQIAEGVLAHMGYEDRATGRIDMRQQVGVRWPLAEVEASGADPADFKSALTEYGNNWLRYEREETPLRPQDEGRIYSRRIRWNDGLEETVLFCREHGVRDGDGDVFYYGLPPEEAVIGVGSLEGGWQIIGY
jgi:hypothetical protein